MIIIENNLNNNGVLSVFTKAAAYFGDVNSLVTSPLVMRRRAGCSSPNLMSGMSLSWRRISVKAAQALAVRAVKSGKMEIVKSFTLICRWVLAHRRMSAQSA